MSKKKKSFCKSLSRAHFAVVFFNVVLSVLI